MSSKDDQSHPLLGIKDSEKQADPEEQELETLAPETQLHIQTDEDYQRDDFTRLPKFDTNRYQEIGQFGRGGMGEVKRVYDRLLGREIAMKTMHFEHADQNALISRFIEEAQATAQLQHPSIVPIYDLGRLDDGRLGFTMKEVRGQTLQAVIKEVHQNSESSWEVTENGWHFRKLVSCFAQVCEAVIYAHERGVVHRDLKPQNIMLGERGEVWVVDWGLVKVLSSMSSPSEDAISVNTLINKGNSIITDRSQEDSYSTMIGTVSGTPAYMSPEQADGNLHLDQRTDVYSLGAVLYEILSGKPPYAIEKSEESPLKMLRRGSPLQVEDALIKGRLQRFAAQEKDAAALHVYKSVLLSQLTLPPELIRVCEHAMERDRSSRYANVEALLNDLTPWLEGTQQRALALQLLLESQQLAKVIDERSQYAQELRYSAQGQLHQIEAWQSEEEKAHLWAQEDEAVLVEREIVAHRVRREALLRTALQHSPGLIEAHLELAEIYKENHERAELEGKATLSAELALKDTLAHISDNHPKKQLMIKYLEGEGALTLVTDPAGAEVLLYRYEIYRRRLIPKFVCSLGHTPLISVPLAPGSYLCTIKHPARMEVRYPVFIERGMHWDGIPPEGGEPYPVYLPQHGELMEEECYIPAGWFWSGGDAQSPKPLPRRRLWSDALVYQRYPVTNRKFMAFLHELVQQGEEDKALLYAPREDGTNNDLSTLIYHYHEGRFSLKKEEKWEMWQDDWPVYSVDWFGANAYAEWESKKHQRKWRLPGDIEWEKITRGVDGRSYPWGEFFDPSWACMRDSHPKGIASPASVYDFPYDESVYGVRGVSGNSRIWCADVWVSEGPPIDSLRLPEPCEEASSEEIYRTLRGGSWYNSSSFLRACYRFDGIDTLRFRLLGFRLARKFTPALT